MNPTRGFGPAFFCIARRYNRIPVRYARRRFLEFIAASPLLGQDKQLQDFVPGKPEEAINVMDFERAARERMPPAHFGYIASGVDDDLTLKANRSAYSRYQLRTRRLIDVS